MENGELLCAQVREMIREEPWYVAAFSNLSALLMASFDNLNWAGFYLLRGGRLVVGPFQGKPACIHIPEGKGVCGTCVKKDEVYEWNPQKDLMPLHGDGKVQAVLDLDSPLPDRFGRDEALLRRIAGIIEECIRWE